MYSRPAAESSYTPDEPRRGERHHRHAPDILQVIERLESQVTNGRRVVGKVMIDEHEFLALLDQLREAIPVELQQARRVIQQREEIILGAQDEAEKIVTTARERAEYLISDRGLTAEARYRSEDVLRHAEQDASTTMEHMERFVLKMLDDVEAVMTRSATNVEAIVSRNMTDIEEARGKLSHRT